MRTCATYDDVSLVIRLYDLRREERMRDARRWFAANFRLRTLEEFQKLYPPGSETHESFRQVTTYWEMVASFLSAGVLNKQLFFESGRELLFVWERVRDVVPAIRESHQDPAWMKNLEQAAESFIEWMNETSPGAYEPFSARVRG